ncbi:glycosyl hydrolase superfamily protein [Actinidia rufa]|uniref:Glycosyl hydrolase superfamily protein n=1 Tax=Actinidia rufa TaxID=165716 RepID=A0A7J0DX63_9ERIC|nr:glycosyl hydrolase superfamily protein [Actinidia rufa]
MQKLQNILDARRLARISVTTGMFQTSYQPSSGTFSAEAQGALVEVLKFLSAQVSPLMVNVYPYFAYAADPANVQLDYALFTAPRPVVQDGGLRYQNIFDATIDGFYWAMESEGVTDVGVVVSETGWPSGGYGNFTTRN